MNNNKFNTWKKVVYVLLFICIFMNISIIYELQQLDNLNSTQTYLGYIQSSSGLLLGIMCYIAIMYRIKTMILIFIIVQLSIQSISIGTMHLLIQLSVDYENKQGGQEPIGPSHSKSYYKYLEYYFISSMTLSIYNFFVIYSAYQIRQYIASNKDVENDIKSNLIEYKNSRDTSFSAQKIQQSHDINENYIKNQYYNHDSASDQSESIKSMEIQKQIDFNHAFDSQENFENTLSSDKLLRKKYLQQQQQNTYFTNEDSESQKLSNFKQPIINIQQQTYINDQKKYDLQQDTGSVN